MDRRNLLLNEMGITRWQLYRPEVLQGAVGVSVSEQVKFIVVTKDNISNAPLFSDVRLSLELNKEDCLCLNFDQIQHITLQHSVRYWLLAENADEIDRTLPYCLNAERIYRSVDWQQFQQDNQAKRELWQQIQQISSLCLLYFLLKNAIWIAYMKLNKLRILCLGHWEP